MALAELLRERGYVYQFSSQKLEEITDGTKRTLYLGIDPSSDSLHVGHVQGFLVLRRFLEDGHKIILLIGGGTGMIGDPSGKSEERNLLDAETVTRNAEAISKQGKQLLGSEDFTMVDNAEWLSKLDLIGFLRDIGKHFSVNAMMQRDSVKGRLTTKEEGISYTEFSYMLLQAYDYLHLHEAEACDLQIGASDQWGNIAAGIDLIRRKTGDTSYGFTSPLLVNKSTGKKFGKSEHGTVWLDPTKTTPFQFYQFWVNTDDESVEEYLLKMTMLSRDEISAALELHKRDKKERHGQQILAAAVTTLVHGEEAARQAEKVSHVLFGNAGIASLEDSEIDMLRTGAPSCEVQADQSIVDVLIACKLADSKREARQFLSDNAVTLNAAAVDEKYSLKNTDFKNKVALLRRGKRNIAVLVLA